MPSLPGQGSGDELLLLIASHAQMRNADGVCRKGQGLAGHHHLQLLLNPFSFLIIIIVPENIICGL